MKSLADFTKKSKVAEANITRDKFYKNEVYKQGEWVLTEQGQVGKIHRRGPNYVLCLTAENTKFRSWITDIKEVFEIGTDAYREYVMSITPGQKVQKPKNTVKVPETIPSKHPTNKMDKHESKSLAQVAAETMLNPKFKSMKETWRYDYSAKIGNTDVKGLGAQGVGGGDAPGMKLAEPEGGKGKPTIKKVQHSCATKVEHTEWGKGNCLKEQHTLDEEGNITHYDVMFEHGLEQNVPVPTLNILVSEMHEHVINDEKNEIAEKNLDPVNPVAMGKKYKDRKDKDIDNDGDTDSSDKYLHKKRKAISKAMAKEHHQKDADGKVIEHEVEDTTPASVEEGKKGLYANIHAKRARGESPAKPGDKDYPAKDAFKKAAKTAKKEEVEVTDESMAQARKNVGASTCWTGYKAKGTKMKGGKKVPNCVKEFSEWRAIAEKK
ncbi:possible cytitidyltransferase [Eurybiavirus PHM1]|uniref:Possible cytitidyltransferase n=1 Tax=Prochlorococcus phage P-HM1 TaxID=445700 RepID=E3SMZ4_9CAUD|nr:possible cytitidyltransferase [Prochlorococcus phage P-HM1]ADO98787.1 possible cytitidyltransferase [Prochlorococcus phage P-HM1]